MHVNTQPSWEPVGHQRHPDWGLRAHLRSLVQTQSFSTKGDALIYWSSCKIGVFFSASSFSKGVGSRNKVLYLCRWSQIGPGEQHLLKTLKCSVYFPSDLVVNPNYPPLLGYFHCAYELIFLPSRLSGISVKSNHECELLSPCFIGV